MKKVILFLVAMFSIVSINAQDLKFWNPVIEAIAKVESDRNPKAVSPSGAYIGYLQISKTVVDDVNEYLGKKVYTYKDRFDIEKSKEMFVYIQRRYNPEKNVEKAIRIWQGGCGGWKRKAALAYYKRVSKNLYLTAYN